MRSSEPPSKSSPSLPPVEDLASRIGAAPVCRLDGETAPLRSFWQQAVTVSVFVRHYGCLFCHEAIHDLALATPSILKTGARIVVVGNGTIEQARVFFQQKGLPRPGVEVVTDAARESYRAAGFERSEERTFRWPGVREAYERARGKGQRIDGIFGDLTQLGGVLVTEPPDDVRFLYRSEFAGDRPDMSEVLTAIPAAPVASAG